MDEFKRELEEMLASMRNNSQQNLDSVFNKEAIAFWGGSLQTIDYISNWLKDNAGEETGLSKT